MRWKIARLELRGRTRRSWVIKRFGKDGWDLYADGIYMGPFHSLKEAEQAAMESEKMEVKK